MDKNIVDEKFEEWTRGSSPEESLVRIFESIRNIPFAVVLEQITLEKGPVSMLEKNKGFCIPKHYLMGEMLRRLKVPCRYCTFSFNWRDLNIEYPRELKNTAEILPVTYHLACEINIDDIWVTVDATWDPGLKTKIPVVNEGWDGRTDTKLAVEPIDRFVHENAEEREKFSLEKIGAYSLQEELKLSRFSMAFNKWLEEVRGTG